MSQLTITDSAAEYLAGLLAEAEASPDIAIRFLRSGRALALRLDYVGGKDARFDHRGRVILTLDQGLSHLLADCRLEVEQTDQGPRLKLE